MDELRAGLQDDLRQLIAEAGDKEVVIGIRPFKALVNPADETAKAMAGMQTRERGLVVRICYDDFGGQLIGLKEIFRARGEDWRIAELLPSTVGIKFTLKADKN